MGSSLVLGMARQIGCKTNDAIACLRWQHTKPFTWFTRDDNEYETVQMKNSNKLRVWNCRQALGDDVKVWTSGMITKEITCQSMWSKWFGVSMYEIDLMMDWLDVCDVCNSMLDGNHIFRTSVVARRSSVIEALPMRQMYFEIDTVARHHKHTDERDSVVMRAWTEESTNSSAVFTVWFGSMFNRNPFHRQITFESFYSVMSVTSTNELQLRIANGNRNPTQTQRKRFFFSINFVFSIWTLNIAMSTYIYSNVVQYKNTPKQTTTKNCDW